MNGRREYQKFIAGNGSLIMQPRVFNGRLRVFLYDSEGQSISLFLRQYGLLKSWDMMARWKEAYDANQKSLEQINGPITVMCDLDFGSIASFNGQTITIRNQFAQFLFNIDQWKELQSMTEDIEKAIVQCKSFLALDAVASHTE